MKISELYEARPQAAALAAEFMREAGGRTGEWFGSGSFDDICTEPGNCSMVSNQFLDWLDERGIKARTITGRVASDPRWAKRAGVAPGGDEDAHTVVLIDDAVVDFTARQFNSHAELPRISTLARFREEWEQTDK